MAEIDLNEIDDSKEVIGLTVQYDDQRPLLDSDYDVLQMGNEVTIVLNDFGVASLPLHAPVIVGLIDGLLSATAVATESLKTLRERVSNDAR